MAQHTVLVFLIKVLFSLLVLHYLGNDIVSPFQTHPKTMVVAFVSLLLYCISYELEPRFTHVGRGGMGLFGSILSVSLASLLFQTPVSFVLYFVSSVLCFLYVLFLNWEMLCCGVEALWSWVQWIKVKVRILLFRAIWISPTWFVIPVYANRGVPSPTVRGEGVSGATNLGAF